MYQNIFSNSLESYEFHGFRPKISFRLGTKIFFSICSNKKKIITKTQLFLFILYHVIVFVVTEKDHKLKKKLKN